jgi:hypothetical protein
VPLRHEELRPQLLRPGLLLAPPLTISLPCYTRCTMRWVALVIVAVSSVGCLGHASATGYTTGPVRWGDSDCDNSVTARDVGYMLQYLAGVPEPPPPSAHCPTIGSTAPVMIWARVWGDIDCAEEVTPMDALAVLRYLSGVPFTPTPTPTPTPPETPTPTGPTPTPTLLPVSVSPSPTFEGPACPTVGDSVSLNDKTPSPTPRTPTPTASST